jgi:hypothetical protein
LTWTFGDLLAPINGDWSIDEDLMAVEHAPLIW